MTPSADKLLLSREVTLVGYASSPLGLGEDLRQAAASLLASGASLEIVDMPTSSIGTVGRHLSPHHTRSPSNPIRIFFQSPFEWVKARSRFCIDRSYCIGNFLWELERFPRHGIAALSGIDEIWAPTRFVSQAFEDAGFTRVFTIPTPAVSPMTTELTFRDRFGWDDSVFVFGFQFDLHSTLNRKNPEALVSAFEKMRLLVPRTVRTALLVKVHRKDFQTPQYDLFRRRCATAQGVYLWEETLPADHVAGFYNTVDAYVSLHRSEGLGRTLIEARQCGLPVICTDYSGAAELIRLSDMQGVPYVLKPCLPGEYPHTDGSVWAEPNIETAAVLMARLVRKGRHRLPAPTKLNEHFSPEKFLERVSVRFDEISRHLATQPRM